MSIAQLQDATDRWKASLDSEDKKWLAQFGRNTQIKIAKLDNASREIIARISGQYGASAASAAANLSYQATIKGLQIDAAYGESMFNALKESGDIPADAKWVDVSHIFN